jgi:hypothetical protein
MKFYQLLVILEGLLAIAYGCLQDTFGVIAFTILSFICVLFSVLDDKK